MSDSLRNHAFDVWKFYAESGHPISLKDLAAQSDEMLGQKVPYQTVLDWADLDDWYGRVQFSFEGSDELSRAKDLLDIAYNGVMVKIDVESSDIYSKGISASAVMFRRLMGKVPKPLWPVMEPQVVKVRSHLYDLVTTYENAWSRSHISSMAGVWADLERYVLPELPVAEGATYDLDEVVLGEAE